MSAQRPWSPRDLTRSQRADRALDGRRMGLSVRQLAQHLEVSERTVRRDLAFMRDVAVAARVLAELRAEAAVADFAEAEAYFRERDRTREDWPDAMRWRP